MSRRVGLVGCVKEKRDGAATDQDLYTSPLFIGKRRYITFKTEATNLFHFNTSRHERASVIVTCNKPSAAG